MHPTPRKALSLSAGMAVAAGLLAAAPAVAAPSAATSGTTYYVSSSSGSDANAGTDPAAPWASLDIVNAHEFAPGDTILLKRGDEWSGAGLTFTESGNEGNPITLSAYGEGDRPLIAPGTLDSRGVHLDGVGDWRIDNIAISDAYEGIALSYLDVSDKRNVTIDSVEISDLTPEYNSAYYLYNHISSGITVKTYQSEDDGIGVNKADPPNRRTALTNFTVTNVDMKNVGTGTWFGGLVTNPSDGFQYAGGHQWTKNVVMDNIQVDDGKLWGINVLFVDGGSFHDLRANRVGYDTNPYGAAGVVVAYAKNVAFDLIHVVDVSRGPGNGFDGGGFDYEGVGDNISLSNSTFDLSDGSSLMLYPNSGLSMTDINVENVILSRWGRDPGLVDLNNAAIRAQLAGGSGQLAGIRMLDGFDKRQQTSGDPLSVYRTLDFSYETVGADEAAPAPTAASLPAGPAAIAPVALGAPRNDTNDSVGTKFAVTEPKVIDALGRLWQADNTRPHSVTLYRDSDKAVIARCAVQPSSPLAADGLKYCSLTTPVSLDPSQSYWLLSTERAGGDTWRDASTVTAAAGLTIQGAGSSTSGSFNVWAPGSRAYGPVGMTFQNAELTPALTAGTRCAAGKAVLTIQATNTASLAASLNAESAYGSKSFANVAAGKSVSHAFTTRQASIPAGSVKVKTSANIDGEDVTTFIHVPYAARSCG